MNDDKKSDWLYFNETLVPEWCRYAEQRLKAVLGFDIRVELTLPSEEEARNCFGKQESLKGLLKLNAEGKCAEIPLPIPLDGVFIVRSQTYVWENLLAERPGVRRITTSNGHEELRLGFPDGAHLATPLKIPKKESNQETDLLEDARKLFKKQPFNSLWTEYDYPQKWLRDALEMTMGKKKRELDETIRELINAIDSHKEELKTTDADDLEHRVLTTFPRWLISRLCKCLYNEYLKCDEDADFIQHLCEQKDIGTALVPIERLIGGRFARKRAKDNALIRIDPLNPVELMASLTGVKRYRFRRKTAALIPENKRQNHVSFDGRICPLESPESELIGLQLQLARGARVAADGSITPSDSEKILDRLGWGTSLIPFVNRNDGARDMMGAKNLRQSVAIDGRQPPSVTTGVERELADKTARLVRVGVCPDCTKDGELALGRDLLVAYMPWYGWNVDDAVVVRRGIVDLMSIEKHLVFSGKVKPGWKCEVASNIVASDIEKGVNLHPGDVIATLSTANGKKTQICYNDPGEAKLVKAPATTEASESIIREIRYELQKTLPLGPGDKLMGRHGNKGVVSIVLEDAEMPHLPNNSNLPEAMRGKPVDILLNPHGVLSRMNPGQLLETHIGWLLHAGVVESELLSANSSATAIGDPSAGIDHEKVRRFLETTGLDRNGAIQLYWGNGRKTENPVVVGYQHFVRLNHVPLLKAQARRGGGEDYAYSQETRQPIRGRKVGGGMRLGEMEVWALAAYGANSILREMLGGKSDAEMARDWTDKTRAPAGGSDKGFPLVLKDWLFALGIDMSMQDNGKKCQFKFLSDDELLSRIGKDHEIVNSADLKEGQFTTFGRDDYEFPGEYLAEFNANRLYLGVFLEACGYRWEGLDVDYDCPIADGYKVGYRLDIASNTNDGEKGYLEIVFKNDFNETSSLKISLHSSDGTPLLLNGQCQLNCLFKSKNNEFHQKSKEFREKRTYDLLKGCISDLLDKTVLCHPKKTSKELIALRRGEIGRQISARGLYDARLFGSLQSPSRKSWGYIRLPRPIANPLFPKQRESNQEENVGPNNAIHDIDLIPVMPLCCRMPRSESKTGDDARSLNSLYKEVITACKLGKNPPKGQKDPLSEAVKNLFDTIAKRLDGKEGLLRHEGLGRRIDRSFRLVIAPDPHLQWNQAGVPASILWEVLGDLAIAELSSHDRVAKKTNLTKSIDGGFSWHNANRIALGGSQKAELLDKYLKRHPETLILLNRQPSLHKYSFQAFHPIVTPDSDGEVLRISPLCCKGFAADFDGDEMVGFLPISRDAQNEGTRLLPENNLLSVAAIDKDRKPEPMLHYDRDLVTGLEFASTNKQHLNAEFAKNNSCEVCRSITEGKYNEYGDFGWELIRHICRDHVGADAINLANSWARLAWQSVTEKGFSFGFYDLFDMKGSSKGKLVSLVSDGKHSGERNVAMMVCSGANGEDQIPQIICKRGNLNGLRDEKCEISSCLVDGMPWQDLFDASWNARHSLCNKKLGTAKAGGLTRKLVMGLWPLGDDGLVAAQSIGERGTQLAMKGIHGSAGVEKSTSALRDYVIGKRPIGDSFDDFINAVTEEGANKYKSVDERQFKVLWDALRADLFATPKDWADLLQGSLRIKLVELARDSQCLSMESPFAKVLFNLF